MLRKSVWPDLRWVSKRHTVDIPTGSSPRCPSGQGVWEKDEEVLSAENLFRSCFHCHTSFLHALHRAPLKICIYPSSSSKQGAHTHTRGKRDREVPFHRFTSRMPWPGLAWARAPDHHLLSLKTHRQEAEDCVPRPSSKKNHLNAWEDRPGKAVSWISFVQVKQL